MSAFVIQNKYRAFWGWYNGEQVMKSRDNIFQVVRKKRTSAYDEGIYMSGLWVDAHGIAA